MMLGATPRELSRWLLGETHRLTLHGCVVGLLGVAPVGPALTHGLYGVPLWDVPVTIAALVTIVAAASVASAYPSRRALRTSPAIVLHED